MKRIDVTYDGQLYSVANRDVDDLVAQISDGMTRPEPFWLEVNSGEGEPRPTRLLLTAGVPIALTPIPDEQA